MKSEIIFVFDTQKISQSLKADYKKKKFHLSHSSIHFLDLEVGWVRTLWLYSAVSLSQNLLESLESKLDVYEEQLVDLNKFCDKLTAEYSHKVLTQPTSRSRKCIELWLKWNFIFSNLPLEIAIFSECQIQKLFHFSYWFMLGFAYNNIFMALN